LNMQARACAMLIGALKRDRTGGQAIVGAVAQGGRGQD
jgi:hypothetical protein